ncbi:hypothetical protein M1601_00910 [Mycoplasma capricolum subsp. capripneumoniae M1601]|nr:hypothetical protein M1601_00910 [Mycoplasma capricolum subsp. capripneumoniae M1601]
MISSNLVKISFALKLELPKQILILCFFKSLIKSIIPGNIQLLSILCNAFLYSKFFCSNKLLNWLVVNFRL